MIDKKEFERRHNIIKQFCKKYKKELIDVSSKVAECYGLCSAEEYILCMQILTDDEFIGNYLLTIFEPSGIDMFESVLSGKITFEEFSEKTYVMI